MGLEDLNTAQLSELADQQYTGLCMLKAKLSKLESKAFNITCAHLKSQQESSISKLNKHLTCLEPLLSDVSHYVTELKKQLRSLHEAELMCDCDMLACAAGNTCTVTVKLLRELVQYHYPPTVGMYTVTELASSVLSSLSGRSDCQATIREAGGCRVIVNLLDPCLDSKVVEDISAALGNMAADYLSRCLLLREGAVTSLLNLMRPARAKRMRVASTIALALLAVKDCAVQDAARQHGAIPDLVDMLAGNDGTLADVAKLALQAIRHKNRSNHLEVARAVRLSPLLVRDGCKMARATDLLALECGEACHCAAKCCSGYATDKCCTDESEVRVRAKPLSLYNTLDVCALLKELGFAKWDLAPIRNNRVTGATLACMPEDEMKYDLCLPRNKVIKLQQVQAALRQFERIAKKPSRGRITELELRIWLASQGVRSCDVACLVASFKKLSSSGDSCVTFWDFVVGFYWFQQQLKKHVCCYHKCRPCC